jgi:rhamnogalacturonan endolyase
MGMARMTLAVACLTVAWAAAAAARDIEWLDRGVVAVKVKGGVFVGWRLLGTDPSDLGFHVYRDGKRVAIPSAGGTNIVDPEGTSASRYAVHAVAGGVEQPAGGTATVWGAQTLRIPLERPAGGRVGETDYTYAPNDVGVGDLDGDGQWELVVKWEPSNACDNTGRHGTGAVLLDAYELSGKRLWRIDLGRNVRAGPHYTQFLIGDYDGDGRAEVACKTAPGTIDGGGNHLASGPAGRDDDAADHRDAHGRVLVGPEYLTVFEGRSGRELATVNYWPPRGSVKKWGDDYGNRVDRFLATNACLDGVKLSMVFQRGYYTRLAIAAYDWDGTKLTRRWTHDSDTANAGAFGQGNHNLAAADVDGDGRDEIIQGAAAIDDDGSLLYRTGLGHGDAMHLGDLDPDHEGLEVWCVHESKGAAFGQELHDARTGKILWGTHTGNDVGRGLAADVDPATRGHEMWSSSVAGIWSCTGEQLAAAKPRINFRIYWDGDLEDELLDGVRLDKWTGNGHQRLITLPRSVCNGSKKTPNFSGDILGDWREEVITHDDDSLYLTTTTIPTPHRLYTLAHDPVYRLAMSWQNVAYNQPPHLGFWLGAGVDKAPRPALRVVRPATTQP